MKNKLCIKSVKMTPEAMQDLEDRGLIIRITPSRDDHRLDILGGTGKGEHLYKSDVKYGSHSLVACTIDNTTFSSFATHPDNEEFILLGGENERPMYLLICYLSEEELKKKMKDGTLSGNDFVCLDCVFNDPYVSFFTMIRGTPHGECAYGDGRAATFYVTEGSSLPLDKINIYDYYDIEVD